MTHAAETIERVNKRLAGLLEDVKRSLRGERGFDTEDVRQLSETVGEMALIAAQSAELRRIQPEIAEQLQLYKSQLKELRTTLIQVRVMLLSRQASVQASRIHTTAVSRWASAFGQTR